MAPAEEQPPKSFGNISEHHWSRARKDKNAEALAYYRERSKAPGVAEGGAERNFYCMDCDGVIPFDLRGQVCPHCGAELDEHVRRYFNWVEINEPPRSDVRALLPALFGVGLLLAALILGLIWWWNR